MNTLNLSIPSTRWLHNNFTRHCIAAAFASGSNYPLVGTLKIEFPDGDKITVGKNIPGPNAKLCLNDKSNLGKLFTGGSLNLAQSYLSSEWDTSDLSLLLEWCSRNEQILAPILKPSRFTQMTARLSHLFKRNSLRGSRINIAAHYDLGNNFYDRWLDPTMTYSAGHFHHQDQSLEEAQIEKFDYIINSLGLQKNNHLLDIGGGWGGFACYVAKHVGCQVTVTTISREQYNHTVEKVSHENLSDLVRVISSDYRLISDRFDRISSIEMFEAVGEEYWPTFAAALQRLLSPGGRIFLQTIIIRDDLFSNYRKNVDFIQKYIFPGGILPSNQILQTLFPQPRWTWHKLALSNVNYANTLAHWRVNFEAAWPQIKYLGFDDNFRRLWRYYLAYCEAGFRSGRIDISQVVIGK
jgi:cyclopropane-fatty-acyl-phospholipid synthase